jgi:hypothetical protein
MVLNASRMNQIESLLASIPDISARTIGQSNTPWLRTKPSLVSIQMKTSVSPEDSIIQLAIWCSAGLQALSNIVDEEVVKPEGIPPTFTVSIKGHSCRFGYKRLESSPDTYFPKEGKHSFLSIFLLLTALVYVETSRRSTNRNDGRCDGNIQDTPGVGGRSRRIVSAHG